jgi:hypothetical protein
MRIIDPTQTLAEIQREIPYLRKENDVYAQDIVVAYDKLIASYWQLCDALAAREEHGRDMSETLGLYG